MNTESRLHSLDAVRGFALLLGVAFHAALSFMPDWPPGIWAMKDNSPSPFLRDAAFVTHIFRMSLFFFIAGYFGRLLFHKLGARGFWTNRAKRILIPLVVGYSVEWFNNWDFPIYMLACMFLVGTVCWLLIDPYKPVFDDVTT